MWAATQELMMHMWTDIAEEGHSRTSNVETLTQCTLAMRSGVVSSTLESRRPIAVA
jgi:hypothetical protein